MALAAGLVIAASCTEQTTEPLGTTISASPTELVVADTGASIIGTINIKADGIWFATSSNDDWFTYTPSSGNGDGTITVSLKENVDEYNEVAGPRAGTITIVCGEQIVEVTVKQAGEPGLDASRTYVQVTSAEKFDATKSFLLVCKLSGVLNAVKPQNYADDKYYYWNAFQPVVPAEDGSITLPDATLAFSFAEASATDKFYLVRPDGKYLYQDGPAHVTSFYHTTDVSKAQEWTVGFDDDGNAVIKNVSYDGGYFLMLTSNYGGEIICGTAYGETESGVALYQDEAVATDEVLSVETSVSVDATATSVSIPVTASGKWSVRCHDDWIKSFTKSGEGDGTIEVTFDAWDNLTEDRTASLLLLGETTSVGITLTQGKFVPAFSVPAAAEGISVAGDITTATFEVKANVAWTVTCPAGVSANPSSGNADATVELTLPANAEADDIVYEVKVATADERVTGDREFTVNVTSVALSTKELPYEESFETSIGDFSIVNKSLADGLSYVWAWNNYKYMKASAYVSGTSYDAESWLRSPGIDLSKAKSAIVSFSYAINYGTPANYSDAFYGIVVCDDVEKKFEIPNLPSKGSWTFYDAAIDLSEFAGKKIKFAFVYKSTSTNAPTVELKNVVFDAKTSTIAEILAADNGDFVVKEAMVVATGATYTVFSDGTGVIFAYEKAKASKVGDKVRIDGAVTLYNGVKEFNNPTLTVISQDNTIEYGDPAELDEAGITAYATAPDIKYVSITGTYDKSARTMAVGTQKVNLYSNADISAFDGKVVTAKGYTIGWVTSKSWVNVIAVSVEEATSKLDICEQIFVDAGYKMEDYTRMEIAWTHNGFWNSTHGTNHSKIQTTESNSSQFAATPQYHRSALPVGTVLVVQGSTSDVANGWMYRPEGWQTKGTKNSTTRPDNVTGKANPVVKVDDAWWGTSFNYRAFNVARVGNPNLTEAQQEELEHVFGIFVPKPLASTDEMLKQGGYDPANYTKLELTYTVDAYYYSTNTTNSSLVTTGSNVSCFIATNIVEKASIPNGSIIVVNYGFQYRPEGWQTLGVKNSAARPTNVGNNIVVVDDTWWGDFNYRGFNLAKFGNPSMTADSEREEVKAAFAIYVPKSN